MAGRLRALAPFARAAALTAAAAISISASALLAGPAWAAASARPVGGGVGSMSCTSAGDCAAVGFLDFPDVTRPLVVSEHNGTWGSAGTVPGLSVLPGGYQDGQLGPVSCSSAGNCAAGGYYQENGNPSTAPAQGLVVTERNGVWGKAKAVPSLAALNAGGGAFVQLMSCRSAGNCTAAGTYTLGDESQQVFVVSEKNGSWGKAEPIRGLAAISTYGGAQQNALSCGSPGNCTIAGNYETRTAFEAFAATQENGVWGPVQTFPAIAAVAKDASMDTLSCRPGGNCTGTGTYRTARAQHVFAISQTHGTWGAARLIPGFAALPRGGPSAGPDFSLSCPSAGNCTVGGFYVSKRDGVQLFVVSEENGTWGRARALPGVAALNTGQLADLEGLVCFSAGTCTAAGDYTIQHKSYTVAAIFVTTEKNGTWGKPERVPGSLVDLGTDVNLVALSCGAPGDCSAGGFYGTKTDDEPFLATEKNGTWGKAKPVPGIHP